MNVLEHWNPVTRDYGLVRCGIDRLCDEFESWSKEIGIKRKRQKITSDFSDSFSALEKLSPLFSKTLFVQSTGDWVGVFQNGIRGSDPGCMVGYLSRRLGVMGMRVCASCSSEDPFSIIWEVYDTEENGGVMPLGYRRTIYVQKDSGRWEFGQSGVPLCFEKVDRYEKRNKKDRFDRELLIEYARQLGVDPFNDSYFQVTNKSPAILFEKRSYLGNLLNSHRSYTLEEVKSGEPWKRWL